MFAKFLLVANPLFGKAGLNRVYTDKEKVRDNEPFSFRYGQTMESNGGLQYQGIINILHTVSH